MLKKKLGQTDIFFPVPAALIGCGDPEEADIVVVASVGMVSSTPPTIGISLDKRRYSLELIRKTKAFSVNIPSAELYKETDFCGLVSGRNANKFVLAGLTQIAGSKVRVPLIEECPFNLECQVVSEIELGDYVLILGEIVETHIDEDKMNSTGKADRIDIAKVNPLVYCATVREYWSIGLKLGDAFQAGKEILKKRERL